MNDCKCGKTANAMPLSTFGQLEWCNATDRAPLCDAYQRLFIGSFVRTAWPNYRPYVSVVNWDLSPHE